MSVIDHVNLPVADVARARAFYVDLMAVLNLNVLLDEAEVVGFGQDSWAFGIEICEGPVPALHLAFAASSHEVVRAFYETGLRLGGTSNGAPGLRPKYGERYYAAYLIDPDGHNIEAVVRG